MKKGTIINIIYLKEKNETTYCKGEVSFSHNINSEDNAIP